MPAERILAECRSFLGWRGDITRLEISEAGGISVRPGLFLDLETCPAESDDEKIREFMLDALAEKLRRL